MTTIAATGKNLAEAFAIAQKNYNQHRNPKYHTEISVDELTLYRFSESKYGEVYLIGTIRQDPLVYEVFIPFDSSETTSTITIFKRIARKTLAQKENV